MRNRVFLGKLSYDTRRRDVERWLEDYGFRRYVNIQMKDGYAFVDFREFRDAQDCVREMDHRELMGSRITVELAHGAGRDNRSRDDEHRYDRSRYSYRNGYYREKYGAPYNTEWKLNVSNISSRIGWQELKDFFRQAGNVTYAECHRQRNGEGAVEFSTKEDMRRALDKLDGLELMGRRLKLFECPSSSSMVKNERRTRLDSHDRDNRRKRSISKSASRGRSRSTSFA